MKFLYFLFILSLTQQSFSQENIWNHYFNVLKANNGLDQNQQIRFEFPWKKDKELLIKLDQYTKQLITENKIKKIFHITTNATSRIAIEIFADTQIQNQMNGLIVKKHWKGLFGFEFSYKIIPIDYLQVSRPLGKIDTYELGFVQFNSYAKSLKLSFPQGLNYVKLTDLIIEISKININQVTNINLVTENSQLVKIDLN